MLALLMLTSLALGDPIGVGAEDEKHVNIRSIERKDPINRSLRGLVALVDSKPVISIDLLKTVKMIELVLIS